MNKKIIKASDRGHANHGWLNSYHTFSFANYYNPSMMGFGALRVVNDDTVAPGMGFGTHPHQNMEIISIPLQGALRHQDSMGNTHVIKKGDIQVMSAGTGIMHSEYNDSETEEVKFLQIWVIPNKQNVEPRYDQISYSLADKPNEIVQVLSPNKEDEGVWIHQNAFFSLAETKANSEIKYDLKDSSNGLFLFVLDGEVEVENEQLYLKDAIQIADFDSIKIQSNTDSFLLFMEVPLI